MNSRVPLIIRTALAAGFVMGASATIAAVTATAPTDYPEIRETIHKINADATIRSIVEGPIPGLKRVVADSTVLYTSNDGRYVMYGVVLDTKDMRNLTDEALSEVRKAVIAEIPADDKIVYSPKDPKYTVTIFTDTSCHYCQMLHKNIKSYMDAGIRIEYVPWPRAGKESADMVKMQSIWCAKDRQKAFDDAIAGGAVSPANCARSSDVPKMWDVGDKLGIDGTPAIYDSTGRQLGGFLPPAQMLGKLQGSATAVARAATAREAAAAAPSN